MSDRSTSVQVGPGLVGCLTILFVLLKVFDKIDWSWWWVFSPLWIAGAVVVAILLVGLMFVIVAAAIK